MPLALGLYSWPALPPHFDVIAPPLVDDDVQALPPLRLQDDENAAALNDRLAAVGFVADRQNCPDLSAQLELSIRRPVDTIVCSVLDIDLTACVQGAAAHATAEPLVAGVETIRLATRAKRGVIVIDSRVPASWWLPLRAAAAPFAATISIVDLSHAYPQADPSLLVYTVLNRKLPPRKLPVEAGAIVIDGIAAACVGSIVQRNKPIVALPMVVRDHDRHESYFVLAPPSQTVGDLVAHLNLAGHASGLRVIRGGDLLRDVIVDPAVPVIKSEVVLHIASVPPAVNPNACIRCGWCFEACPTRVQPATLLEAAQTEDFTLARRGGLSACIECGICSYVCPSHLPLLSSIRALLDA